MSSHLILLAHGSKDNNWCQTFEKGLKTINNRLEHNASLAYMEMASPSLEHIISKQYLLGQRDFDVLPLFFAAGRHLLHDVPEKVARLNQQYAAVRINLLEEVGSHDAFWSSLGDLIVNKYKSVTAVESDESAGIQSTA